MAHSNLKICTQQDVAHLFKSQVGESKFGEVIYYFSAETPWENQLKNFSGKYVLFGIPEDVGVRANRGRPGAYTAWQSVLKTVLNLQNNHVTKGANLALLGKLDFSKKIAKANLTSETEPAEMHGLLTEIDAAVVAVVQAIVAAGKIPIAIGGGHNNAYGMLRGTAEALKKPVNALNIDAHTDLRETGYRHSGNGFRYAWEEKILDKYFIFGLHEYYLLQSHIDFIAENKNRIKFNTFEDLRVRRNKKLGHEIRRASDFVSENPYGVEVDCDSIELVASSALTPSGFSPEIARRLVHSFGQDKNARYLHICEAAPDPNNPNEMMAIGKLISYLIVDFMQKR